MPAGCETRPAFCFLMKHSAAKAARAKVTPAAAKAVSATAVKPAPVAVAKATPATVDDESETAKSAVKTSETVTSN